MSAGKMIKHGLAILWPGAILVKGKQKSGRVAITFDDGPHPENTRRILDILDRHAATATFFLQGKEAEKYPELVREVSNRGHQIGNHGYAHLDAKRVPTRAYVEEVRRTQDTLQNITGARLDRVFRPPFGNVTGATFLSLALANYRFVFWSADSRDSFIKDPPQLLAYVQAMPIISGDILLFHEDYSHTVTALPAILQMLRSRALTFGLISDM